MGIFDDIGSAVGGFFGQGAQFQNGQITQKGSGLLGWASENPALFTGYSAAALGATQGLTGMESLGLGGQAASNVQSNQIEMQNMTAQRQANLASAQLNQQKLLLDIEKAKQDTRQGDVTAALQAKEADQKVINDAYDIANKQFPKDPKAAADYAQKLIMQRTKGGQVSIGNKWFGGILGSRPITYTPAQASNVAMQ